MVKVAGANTRLIAASAREQERLAEVAAQFLRRRSDALSAAHAGSVQGSAVFAAAAAASGNRAAAIGSGGQAACRSKRRWRSRQRRRHSAPRQSRHRRRPLPPEDPRHSCPQPHQPPTRLRRRRSLARAPPRGAARSSECRFTADARRALRGRRIERRASCSPRPKSIGCVMNEKDILKVVQKVAGRPMRIKITLGNAATAPAARRRRSPQDDVSRARARASRRCSDSRRLFPDARFAWCEI